MDKTITELLGAVEKETTGTGSLLALHAVDKQLLEDALKAAGKLDAETQRVVNEHYDVLTANDDAVAAALLANLPPVPPDPPAPGSEDAPAANRRR